MRKKFFKYLRIFTAISFLLIATFLIFIFVVQHPSNNRNWEVGMEIIPKFNINGNNVTIQNVRDFHYDIGKVISRGYLDRSVDVAKITKVWFVVEPFIIKPWTNFKGVAHTYFVFDFSDQEPLVVSVEARREKGESYDSWKGLFNQFELIYIWGTEQDETVQRVVMQNNKLYMYPLQISNPGAKALFLQMANTSHDLESNPRFYNTFNSNCTNELAKAANKVKPGAIPFNSALFLPGYATEELYKLGYIPNSLPIDDIKNKYYISDIVRSTYKQPDFSKQLRFNLN